MVSLSPTLRPNISLSASSSGKPAQLTANEFFLTAQARKMASFLLIDLYPCPFHPELKAAHQTSQNVVHFRPHFSWKGFGDKARERILWIKCQHKISSVLLNDADMIGSLLICVKINLHIKRQSLTALLNHFRIIFSLHDQVLVR